MAEIGLKFFTIIKIFPVRETILDYVDGRNERLRLFVFLTCFFLAFGRERGLNNGEIADYDLNDPQDRELHELYSSPITQADINRTIKIRENFLNKQ